MRIIRPAFAFTLFCLTLQTRAVAQERGILLDRPIRPAHQLALVIGNQQYAASPLQNPVNDARDVAARLTMLGYEVNLVLNANRSTMGQATEEFTRRISIGDVALFYYSGHGMQLDGENYLVPVDFDFTVRESAARFDLESVSRIQAAMESSGAQLNILVLDACRNNPFHHETRGNSAGLAMMQSGRGTFIEFATAPGRPASDNSSEHNGLFTKYLVEMLGVPGLDLNGVFDLVRQRVDNASNGNQVPWTQSSVVGRYIFLAPPEPDAAAQPASRDSARSAAIAPASLKELESEMGKLALKASALNDNLTSAERATRGAGGLPAPLRHAWEVMNNSVNQASEALKAQDLAAYRTAVEIARDSIRKIEEELVK